jgi:DNA-binding CsgD family transcriptional regulator
MLPLERLWDKRNRTVILLVSAAIIALIAAVDWWIEPYESLGFLYLFPIMTMAVFLPRWVVVVIGIGCAILAERFSPLEMSYVRLGFEALALGGCGLFVREVILNRQREWEAKENLRVLAETTPAAIVTVDGRGFIELANRAAIETLLPRDGQLIGNPIAAFLPELHHALRWEDAPPFRTSMQCLGHRGNGEVFTADVWFSTYNERGAPKVAAIIVDMSEEKAPPFMDAALESSTSLPQEKPAALSARETEVLRLLVQGLANKEIAGHMDVSESVVKNTLQQLFFKTGVRTRSQLVRVALEHYRNVL